MGAVTAVGHWFRLDVHGRWRSLLVLALLIAFASGTVMAAAAGARRGATAVDRLWARTLPATVAVLPNEPGFDWERIRALPDVAALSPFVVGGGYEIDGAPADFAGFPPVGNDEMRTIERPVVLRGRLADPSRADEVVVSPVFAKLFGKGVGDTVTIGLYTPESLDASAAGVGGLSTEGAPVIEATIVGVIRSPWFSDRLGGVGGLAPSPGLYARYRPNLVGDNESVYINALVRLKGGESAIPRFRADLARVTQRTDIEVWNLAADARRLGDVTGFEADSLLAFALAAAVAGLFFVGQSVSRYAAAVLNDLQVLRTFGMTSGQLRLSAALGPALAAVAGVIAGATGAVAASSRFPIGSASLIEPNPGVDLDAVVIGLGLVLVPAAVAAGAVVAAVVSLRSLREGRDRPSSVAAAASRAGLAVPVLVGVRFALEPGRGHRAVPVRAAVLGAVVGVTGVLAALTFAHGVDDATSNPARFGQFPLQSFLGMGDVDFVPAEDLLDAIARNDDVVAVNDTRLGVAERGDQSVGVYSLDPVGQPLDVVVTDGRLPDAAGEVTLGPVTADRLGVEVGDTVRLVGTRGEHELTVTGVAFVPQSPHDNYSSGAWVTRAGYDRLFEGFKFHIADIQLRPGADRDAVAARLQESIGAALGDGPGGGEYVSQPVVPEQLAELRQVRRLPVFLAGFLVVLALGAVGHALASAVRRRRHDIAVLRVLGLTRRESRLIVVTQAVVLALVGLAVGTPLGVAVGRIIWQRVADRTPVAYVPPVAVWALMLIVPIVLAAANVLAAWPSHRAATLRVAPVLRAE